MITVSSWVEDRVSGGESGCRGGRLGVAVRKFAVLVGDLVV